ncbi:MAG: CCA tRNA nucleotidyltransferase [Proteobacteria bacterium]|nr:CCA tRNA nucleotidyltransferase [Pseudomonadota bacterium]
MSAPDRRYNDALKAMKSLEKAGYRTMMAGGCVRDRLLGTTPADYDLATTATPEQGMLHFRTEKLTTVPTGVDHGTFTLLMPSGPVEITTLRKDVSTDGRHAEVAFGTDFAEDAARRDFTINALFEDADGQIVDFVGGQNDLKSGVLRFVGEPETRIHEDYLRILRLFRFWSTLGFTPATETLVTVADARDGLARISQERVTQEWWKMSAGPALAPALQAMIAAGVFRTILPEVTPCVFPTLVDLKAWQSTSSPPVAVLAGLCLADGLHEEAALTALAERMRMSRHDGKRLAFFATARRQLLLAKPKDTAESLLFLDGCEAAAGQGSFEKLYAPVLGSTPDLAAALQAVQSTEAKFGHRRHAELPLSGKDVVRQTGLTPGPEVGALLAELKRAYYNGEWTTKEHGIAFLAARRKE